VEISSWVRLEMQALVVPEADLAFANGSLGSAFRKKVA